MKKTVVQRTAEEYSREETEAMFELAFGTEPDRVIVIYEDVIAGFSELTAEEIGLLILAARDYITDGTEPVFADRTMRYSWANFRKNLVYSTNLYRIKEIQAQYAHSKELHKQHKSLEEYLCFLHDCSNFGSPEITRSQQKSDDFNITESNITQSNTTEQKQNETKTEQNTNPTKSNAKRNDTDYTSCTSGNDSYDSNTSGNDSIPHNTDEPKIQQVLTGANTCQPTTTPSTTPNTATTTSTTTKPKTETNSKATNKDNSLGKIEDKEGSGEKGEREQAFSKQEISRIDFASALDADIVEEYGEDAYASFGEEVGHVLDDVDEADAEDSAEDDAEELKESVVTNLQTTQAEPVKSVSTLANLPKANTIGGANIILQTLTPKQSIYVEPDEGKSEEAFQARRRQEMIAKLMSSMPQEQTAYCTQRLSNVRTLGNLPEMRVV